MSVYLTEAEQIALIKTLWQKYSTLVMSILALLLLTFSGIKYWYWHQNKILQLASISYEKLMSAVAEQDSKKIQAYSQPLLTKYKSTVYATVASLTLAKQAVEVGEYKDAEQLLRTIIDTSKQAVFVDLAKLRLARILTMDKLYSQAITLLLTINKSIYAAKSYELLGDNYMAIHDYDKAKHAYQTAILQCEEHGISHGLLEQKIAEVVLDDK